MARFDRKSFKSGMFVRTADRKFLGTVAVCGTEKLYLRKSAFSHHRWAVTWAQVDGIVNGEVILKAGQDTLEDLGTGPLPEKMVQYIKPFRPDELPGHGDAH